MVPGVAYRIAELDLQSRQHYASLFRSFASRFRSPGCGSAALTIRAGANLQLVPFFVLLGAKLAPRGANLCAPETPKSRNIQLHPVVEPHVLHFKHVPFRTSVKLPHSPHESPT